VSAAESFSFLHVILLYNSRRQTPCDVLYHLKSNAPRSLRRGNGQGWLCHQLAGKTFLSILSIRSAPDLSLRRAVNSARKRRIRIDGNGAVLDDAFDLRLPEGQSARGFVCVSVHVSEDITCPPHRQRRGIGGRLFRSGPALHPYCAGVGTPPAPSGWCAQATLVEGGCSMKGAIAPCAESPLIEALMAHKCNGRQEARRYDGSPRSLTRSQLSVTIARSKVCALTAFYKG